jgi:predicted TIM-barrel fold metal-dependent hydrolase
MPNHLVAGDEGLRLLGLDQLLQQVPDLIVIVGHCGHRLGRR